MTEALIGFLIGVASTYLSMAQHYEGPDADGDLKALLSDLKTEAPEAEMHKQ